MKLSTTIRAVLLLLVAASAWGVPARVQSAAGHANSVSVSVPFGSNNTAGNVLVALVENVITVGQTPYSIPTDTAGNTWLIAAPAKQIITFTSWVTAYYVFSCAAGANTVTVAGQTSIHLHIYEVSGVFSAPYVLQTYGVDSQTTSLSVATTRSVTNYPAEYVVAMFYDWSGNRTLTAGSGYTLRHLEPDAGFTTSSMSEDGNSVTGLSGAQTATAAGNTGGDAWGAVILCFRGAGQTIVNPDPVQHAFGVCTSCASQTAVFPVNNTSGHLLIAFAGTSTNSITFSISDSAGNAWTADATVGTAPLKAWHACSVGGANTVTITPNTTTNVYVHVYEVVGASCVLDQVGSATATASGTYTATTSGSVTSGTEYVIADFFIDGGGTNDQLNPGSGYMGHEFISNAASMVSEDSDTSTGLSGAQSATANAPVSNTWKGIILTFAQSVASGVKHRSGLF